MLKMRLFAAAALLVAGVANAGPLLVTESGVWGATAPTTTWSAPNDSWSYSFLVDSNPTVSNVSVGHEFTAPFSNFVYTLNGSTVATTPTSVVWYNTANGGALAFSFDAGDLFNEFGPQTYSGSESAPTILPGVYPLVSPSDFISTGNPNQPLTGNLVITAVPEPSTVALLLAGAGLIGAIRLRKRV